MLEKIPLLLLVAVSSTVTFLAQQAGGAGRFVVIFAGSIRRVRRQGSQAASPCWLTIFSALNYSRCRGKEVVDYLEWGQPSRASPRTNANSSSWQHAGRDVGYYMRMPPRQNPGSEDRSDVAGGHGNEYPHAAFLHSTLRRFWRQTAGNVDQPQSLCSLPRIACRLNAATTLGNRFGKLIVWLGIRDPPAAKVVAGRLAPRGSPAALQEPHIRTRSAGVQQNASQTRNRQSTLFTRFSAATT